jgi:DNA-binding NarL/FixJ family response regulator
MSTELETTTTPPTQYVSPLDERETKLLQLKMEGATDDMVARNLGVKRGTVTYTIRVICEKFGLEVNDAGKSREERTSRLVRAIVYAFRKGFVTISRSCANIPQLTEKQFAVVALLEDGLQDKQIATKLSISPAAVTGRMGEARRRWRANSREELVVIALKTGLFSK